MNQEQIKKARITITDISMMKYNDDLAVKLLLYIVPDALDALEREHEMTAEYCRDMKIYQIELTKTHEKICALEAANEKLTQALAWYADEKNWAKDNTIPEPVFIAEINGGNFAREALAILQKDE